MSNNGSSAETGGEQNRIKPLLGRGHWGGWETIGHGHAVKRPELSDDDNMRAGAYARHLLERFMQRGMIDTQGPRFSGRDRFAAEAHAPGTIIAFLKESLRGRGRIEDGFLKECEDEPAPSRPGFASFRGLVIDGDRHRPTVAMHDRSVSYRSEIRLGVVLPGPNDLDTTSPLHDGVSRQRVMSVPVEAVGLHHISTHSGVSLELPVINLGEVNRYAANGNGDDEVIERVNVLEIVAEADPDYLS